MDAHPYTVLLINASSTERNEWRRLLKHDSNHGYVFLDAATVADGLRLGQEQQIDCILLDHSLIDNNANAVRAFTDNSDLSSCAVVVLAERGDESIAAEALKQGASDCVLREATKAPGAIQRAVASAIAQAKFAAEMQTQHEERDRRLEELHKTIGKMDEEIRARDEFLSITAHELRTPVAAVKLKLQSGLRVLKNSSPEKQLSREMLRDLYEGAERQITRLSSLIDSLLDLSRMEAGYFSMHFEPVAVGVLIHDVLERVAYQLTFAKCPVSTVIDPGLTVYWDRLRIEQVITNLLVNAMRYACGTPIQVTARKVSHHIQISVSDRGPGISQEHQQRIFERYERGASSANNPGLGLGLFIARQIVNAHHGSIQLESEPGNGATFIIRLPIDARTQAPARK